MKSLKSFFAALLFFTATTVAADEYSYLTVSQTGTATNFEVSKIDKITFDASNMILNLTDGTKQTLPLASLSKMFFSDGDLTGIASTSTTQKLELADGTLRVSLKDGEQFTLYNIKGEEVMKSTTSTTIDMNALKKGVYIVKVGSTSKKILNK